MTLIQISTFVALSLLARVFGSRLPRRWTLLTISVLAVFWLQPASPIRNLDFWLPLLTISIAAAAWAVTLPAGTRPARRDGIAGFFVLGLALAVALTRYIPALCCLTPSRPPETLPLLLGMGIFFGVVWLVGRGFARQPWTLHARVLAVIFLFIILKSEPLAQLTAAGLRGLMGQDPTLAQPTDLRWLGFSYLAFRLLHTLRDRLSGRLPALYLDEFLTYAVFFPSLTAGPIDRVERFQKDLQTEFQLDAIRFLEAGERLAQGLFMKFVLGDALALFALNPANAAQVSTTGWAWLLLYAYALRLFFDFAGYTHMAIGLGLLFGIRLPENFNRPYLQPNLTAFWNGWHMTLTNWLRAYVFNPFTRALRARKWSIAPIILLGQLLTMLLVGLWHGITLNFAIWGLWHGLGLFTHNRWADFAKGRLNVSPQLAAISGALLTFHFVALGWVWFALPDPGLAGRVLRLLAGGAP
ncbi:MAG: MBOAT family protein [Anaerolineae bacterium]|nr:MAG: MBOAT family protein [Anaerolineae bacterium]